MTTTDLGLDCRIGVQSSDGDDADDVDSSSMKGFGLGALLVYCDNYYVLLVLILYLYRRDSLAPSSYHAPRELHNIAYHSKGPPSQPSP